MNISAILFGRKDVNRAPAASAGPVGQGRYVSGEGACPPRRLLLLGLCLFHPPLLLAHGGLPESTAVIPIPGQSLPVVQTTFGVIEPIEARDWAWVCPDITGYTSLSAAHVDAHHRWYFGSYTGLWRSDDRCTWTLVGGLLEGLYITSIQSDTVNPDRIWVSTSTADEHNALFWSDDGGLTFSEGAFFGEGSTIRGFVQGGTGTPFYVVGWRDGRPYLWISSEGSSTWTEVLVDETGELLVYPLGVDHADPPRAYLALRGESSDTLVRAHADGSLEALLEIDDQITAFSPGFESGELLVGGRYVGMYRSHDDGQSWEGPVSSPEAGCLKDDGARRFQCVNNFEEDASVLCDAADGSDSVRLAWFGDVHGVAACPSGTQTADVCGPLWEAVKATNSLDLKRDEDDTGAPGEVAVDSESAGGAGCAIAGSTGGHPPWPPGRFWVYVGMLMVGWALRVPASIRAMRGEPDRDR